jgi:hypothetical protein
MAVMSHMTDFMTAAFLTHPFHLQFNTYNKSVVVALDLVKWRDRGQDRPE